MPATPAILAAAVGVIAMQATLPSPTTTSQPTTRPTVHELLDRHVEATGGRAAYAALTSRRAEGTFSMADLGVEGTITLAIRGDGNATLTIVVPNFGTLRQGVSDGVAWSIHPTQGPRLLDGVEARALAASLALSPHVGIEGYRDARVGELAQLNGRPAWRLHLDGEGGIAETRFYDVESGLLVRASVTVPSEIGELTVITRFSDYEDEPPIRMALKVQQAMPGLSPEMALKRVEHNVELPDALFALPPEVAALRPATTRPAATRPRR